jgi:hypothetical protein
VLLYVFYITEEVSVFLENKIIPMIIIDDDE